MTPPRRELSRLKCTAAALWGQFLVLHEQETSDIESALERFADAGDETVAHELRLALGRLLVGFITGGVDDSLHEVETVRALIPLCGDPLVRFAALNQIAWALGTAARYEEAIAAGDHLVAEAEASGIDFAVNHGLLGKASSLVGLRRFAEAQQTLSQVLQRLQQSRIDGPQSTSRFNRHAFRSASATSREPRIVSRWTQSDRCTPAT